MLIIPLCLIALRTANTIYIPPQDIVEMGNIKM